MSSAQYEALANSTKAGNAPLTTLSSPRSAKHAVGLSPHHRYVSDFFSKP